MKMFRSANCIFLSLVLATTLLADPSAGRLSDGRAYRTSKDGVEIVDYIAELELEKGGLEDQVRALQNELNARRELSGSNAPGNCSQVQEALNEQQLHNSELQTQLLKLKDACGELQVASNCDSQIEQARLKLRQQSTALQQEIDHRRQLLAENESLKSSYSDLSSKNRELTALYQAALSKGKRDLQALKTLEDQQAVYLARLSSIEEKSKAKDQSVKNLELIISQMKIEQSDLLGVNKDLSRLREENLSLRSAVTRLEDNVVGHSQDSGSSAKLTREIQSLREKLKAYESRASYKPQSKSSNHLKINRRQLFQNAYEELTELEQERSRVFSTIERQESGMKLTKVTIKSRRGVTLEFISKRINAILRDERSIQLFYPDLQDLISRTKNDLDLAKRVSLEDF